MKPHRTNEVHACMQVMAFPTARRLAAALAHPTGRAGSRRGVGSELGAGAARGAPRCRVGVETLAGASNPVSSASSQPAAQGECPELAQAPPRMPPVLMPESTLATDSHAVHISMQDPTLHYSPPPPPDPALGGVVLTGGGVSAVCEGRGFAAHVTNSKSYPVSANLSLAPLGAGDEQQPIAHAADSEQLLLPAGRPGSETGAQGASVSQSLKKGPRPLRCAWRQRLRECVDAAPVVVAQPCARQDVDEKTLDQNPSPLPGWRWYALACSHGGDVVCIEGRTGGRVWGGRLPGRANAGLAVTADLQARAFRFDEVNQGLGGFYSAGLESLHWLCRRSCREHACYWVLLGDPGRVCCHPTPPNTPANGGPPNSCGTRTSCLALCCMLSLKVRLLCARVRAGQTLDLPHSFGNLTQTLCNAACGGCLELFWRRRRQRRRWRGRGRGRLAELSEAA